MDAKVPIFIGIRAKRGIVELIYLDWTGALCGKSGMKFKAKIQRKDINPYMLVSHARARRIKADWKRPMPVLVQVNGKPDPAWQVNMMPAGDGSFYLYLDGAVGRDSASGAGDMVEMSVVFDHAY